MQARRPIVKRLPLRLTIFALATAVLCGCGRVPDRAELVFINGAEPELLDPPLSTAQATSRVMYALFEGLTSSDSKGVPQPGVAKSWEVSPDGLRYTFHLRPEAVWSNGDPVAAEDFLYSWRRTLTPRFR